MSLSVPAEFPDITIPSEARADAAYETLRLALTDYLDEAQIANIYHAYLFGAQAHQGQMRQSGDPYISHPLAVATILAEMRMDADSIAAAILHDVIEDTPTGKEQIAERFGEDVAQLVDGVSKLTQIEFESKVEAQAENFRKMLLAMVQDIRVIIIKLADRLHNMRTLGAMRSDKRRRIARETLEIYSPIANRLGMNVMRSELQELGFSEFYPMRHRVIAESVRKARGNRKEIVSKIQVAIEERLLEDGLVGEVDGREKMLYSIYQKMRHKQLSFSEVFDVYAFRITVDSVDSCYRVLGAIHNLYKPLPGKFKDYVAIPKANGYQSLHTILFGPYGVPIEVQIRTREMDRLAEAGVAAHWLYKQSDEQGSFAEGRSHRRVRQWMRSLLEMQKSAGDSLEFLENVKIDLFPEEVYVFTPKGTIMELPRGSTAVDFAYAVHTDVGNRCVAAKIDRRLAPLSTPLINGQTVRIITAPAAQPNPTWLNFVVTGKARTNIRHYLKNLQRDESIELGRRMLEQALKGYALSINDLSPGYIQLIIDEFRSNKLEDIYEDIGLGNRPAPLVARRIAEAPIFKGDVQSRSQTLKHAFSRYMPAWLGGNKMRPLAITGTEGMVVTFARCCHPIPGDSIQGFVSAGRGIVVHTESCKNVADFRNNPEKWVDVRWETHTEGEFPVDIRVDVINRRGVLAIIASAISEMDTNINNVTIDGRDGKYSALTFSISVQGRVHLARVMRHVKTLEMVSRITRVKG